MRIKKNLLAVLSLITALALMMSVVYVGAFSASAATDDTITVDLSNFVDNKYSFIVNGEDQDGDNQMLKLVVPAGTNPGSNLAGNGMTIKDLDPSKKYTVSFWKKGDAMNGSYLSVAGEGDKKTQAFIATEAGVWTKFTLSDIEPKDDGTIVLNILACNGKTVDSTTYIDAITVTEQDDTITVDLSNFVDDKYSFIVNGEDQDGDNQMLKLVVPAGTNPGSNLAGNGMTIKDLDPSKKYTVSFWKKGDALNGSNLSVAGKGDKKTQAFIATAAGVWTKFTLSDIEPKDDGTIVLNILACNGKTVDSTTYIDAITVTEQGSNTSDNDTSFVSTRMIKPGEFAYGTVATAIGGGRDDGDNQQLQLSVPANEAKSVPSISITGLDPNKKYTISLWVNGDGFSNGNFWINEANVASGVGSAITLTVPKTDTADWVELEVKDVSPTPTWTVQCGIWLKNTESEACVLYADTITVSEQADSSSNPGTDSAIRIACVGDSITHGTITGGVDYPAQLLGILGDGYIVGNFGVSGSAAMKSHWKSYWTRDAFEMSSNWNPDKVIIMLGTNDASSTWDPEAYVKDLTDLVQHYQSLSTAPVVYIATSPTCYADTQQATTINTVVCELQKQVAEDLGCTLIDINTLTQGLGDHFPDTIHPDAEGYKIIADAMAAAVSECTHEKTDDAIIEEPTYFKAGSKDIVCKDCKETVEEDVVIPAANNAVKDYTVTYNADNTVTVAWEYTTDFMLDLIKDEDAVVKFNYEIAGYENAVPVNGEENLSVTLSGFNAARLDADLKYWISVESEVLGDTSKLVTETTKTVVASTLVDDESDLGKLMAAIDEAEEAVVNGQVANTETLVSNTISVDIKNATASLRFVASQDLINKLNLLGREGRTVTLYVTIDGVERQSINIATLTKVTMVNISGLSFEQLNGKITVQLGFDYEGTENDFPTDVIEFNCGEIITDADTDVAIAFATYMN